jgi:hypothetical protein
LRKQLATGFELLGGGVLGKATKDTEAGAMPTGQAWEKMAQFNEELVKAGTVLVGEGLKPSSTG